ncbi:uncharacterized protein LOC141851259 [Brevipalpus obovatus]|uniref:uncharacterized protein LOC141851259 n=1 Tax=Brevipalpus obovatus TaxID=246614 RepID=UPI003D9F8CBD
MSEPMVDSNDRSEDKSIEDKINTGEQQLNTTKSDIEVSSNSTTTITILTPGFSPVPATTTSTGIGPLASTSSASTNLSSVSLAPFNFQKTEFDSIPVKTAVTVANTSSPPPSSSSASSVPHTPPRCYTFPRTNQDSSSSSSSQSQKRPMNAFLIFCKRHRSVVKQKYPHLENRRITKILGEWWAALEQDQKAKYTELARSNKEAFMKANPHFKWYKINFKSPTTVQPPSPPQINFQSSSSTSSTSAVPLSGQFGSLFGTNLQLLCTPGISGTNSSNNNSPNNITTTNSNSTPKPPKKRYLENLENGEYKSSAMSNVPNSVAAAASALLSLSASASSSPSSTSSQPLNPGGPPILDIDTMNRVIESALGGSNSTSSNHLPHRPSGSNDIELFSNESRNILGMNISPPSKLNSVPGEGDSDNSNSNQDHAKNFIALMPSRSTESADSDKNGSDSIGLGTSKGANISRSNLFTEPNDSTSNATLANNNSSNSSCSPGNNTSGDKPLNLSSFKVLHTSNQQIIDHFIDKWLGPGGSSSTSSAPSSSAGKRVDESSRQNQT